MHEDYIHRNGRELVPTPKAFSLFFALKHFGVTEITSPELTGDWEYKLKLMEAASFPRAEFMDHIEQVTRDLVERIRGRRHSRRRVRRRAGALPEVRRHRAGELPQVPVPEVRLLAVAGHARAASGRPRKSPS